MVSTIKAYLKFLWKSTNEHGIHSPFVFNLITKCFYDKTKYPEYEVLDNYRKTLLQNKTTIEVTDFGAGSRIFKSNKRPINQIARNAGISAKRAKLLFRMVRYLKPEFILEIGTSLGLATSALALNKFATITTLEGCPNTIAIAKNQMQLQMKEVSKDINFVETTFEKYIKFVNQQPASEASGYHFVYFDGNHSEEATLKYFELLLPTIYNETVWIFDDIHWSEGMKNAWETIKNHPKVTVTIDTFQWGIVFFRKEQHKEHFVIRI